MKIEVIKDGFYVSNDLSNLGLISRNEFESSFIHMLIIGDIWESVDNEDPNFTDQMFKCEKSDTWKDQFNDGWWEYQGNEGYFKIIN